MEIGQIGASRLTETADILSKQLKTTMLSVSLDRAVKFLPNNHSTSDHVLWSHNVPRHELDERLKKII